MGGIYGLNLWVGLLLMASYIDIRHRKVPDWLNLCIAFSSLPGFQPGNLAGILCAMPFLLAGICWGGIGGGAIKFMAACGIHLGGRKGLEAAILGTCLLLSYHLCVSVWSRLRGRQSPKAYPMVPFLTAACLAISYSQGVG